MKVTVLVLQSVVAGLAVAFVVLVVKPELLLQQPNPTSSISTNKSSDQTFPVDSHHHLISFADAVESAAPAVVNIYTSKYVPQRNNPLVADPLFQRFFGDAVSVPPKRLETNLGSGIIVSADGLIITNYHVIFSADHIEVALSDGRSLHAELVGSDPESDLAVLKIGMENYPTIPIGDSKAVRIGDIVLAIGNPFGVGQTVTQGIVSATGRNRVGVNTFENFIQTDADINPGNSGGALINTRGELIGISSAIVSQDGGSQGVSFAIPADAALAIMREIIETGAVVRGWLGVEVRNLGAETAARLNLPRQGGVLIERVVSASPAKLVGLRAGDAITHINGEGIVDSREAVDVISSFEPGTRIDLTVVRQTEEIVFAVAVAERPRMEQPQ